MALNIVRYALVTVFGEGPEDGTVWGGPTVSCDALLARPGRCDNDTIVAFTNPEEANIIFRWNMDRECWQAIN